MLWSFDTRVAQWLERRRKDLMFDHIFHVVGSHPTLGHGCQFFGKDHVNPGPVSHQVWYVKKHSLLKAISATHRIKFAALSLVMVTATGKLLGRLETNIWSFKGNFWSLQVRVTVGHPWKQ
jgi:hypothetical protein